jgi:hypothetical protein
MPDQDFSGRATRPQVTARLKVQIHPGADKVKSLSQRRKPTVAYLIFFSYKSSFNNIHISKTLCFNRLNAGPIALWQNYAAEGDRLVEDSTVGSKH